MVPLLKHPECEINFIDEDTLEGAFNYSKYNYPEIEGTFLEKKE